MVKTTATRARYIFALTLMGALVSALCGYGVEQSAIPPGDQPVAVAEPTVEQLVEQSTEPTNQPTDTPHVPRLKDAEYAEMLRTIVQYATFVNIYDKGEPFRETYDAALVDGVSALCDREGVFIVQGGYYGGHGITWYVESGYATPEEYAVHILLGGWDRVLSIAPLTGLHLYDNWRSLGELPVYKLEAGEADFIDRYSLTVAAGGVDRVHVGHSSLADRDPGEMEQEACVLIDAMARLSDNYPVRVCGGSFLWTTTLLCCWPAGGGCWTGGTTAQRVRNVWFFGVKTAFID